MKKNLLILFGHEVKLSSENKIQEHFIDDIGIQGTLGEHVWKRK